MIFKHKQTPDANTRKSLGEFESCCVGTTFRRLAQLLEPVKHFECLHQVVHWSTAKTVTIFFIKWYKENKKKMKKLGFLLRSSKLKFSYCQDSIWDSVCSQGKLLWLNYRVCTDTYGLMHANTVIDQSHVYARKNTYILFIMVIFYTIILYYHGRIKSIVLQFSSSIVYQEEKMF